jgi:hypothetical protein
VAFSFQPWDFAVYSFGNYMNLILRVGIAAAMQTLLVLPASAQWQGSAGISGRNVTHTEYDRAGRHLVRERGWMPGVAMNAAYRTGAYTWFAEGEIYDRDIDYDGQTQTGRPVNSKTATRQESLRIGGTYALGSDYSVLAAVEWDKWTRDIIGVEDAAGLQEEYRSRRLIAGARKTWYRAAGGVVALDAAIVLSEPERMRVEIPGLLDPASLETRSSHGVRLGASIRPAFAPYLELRGRYDWIKVPRSGDTPVTLNGQYRGTIAQPEHEKQAVSFTVSYIF